MKRKVFVAVVMPVGVALIVLWNLYQFAISQTPGSWVAAVLSVPVGLIIIFAFSFEFGSNGECDGSFTEDDYL